MHKGKKLRREGKFCQVSPKRSRQTRERDGNHRRNAATTPIDRDLEMTIRDEPKKRKRRRRTTGQACEGSAGEIRCKMSGGTALESQNPRRGASRASGVTTVPGHALAMG